MDRFGAVGWIGMGVILLVFGWLLKSTLIEKLLDLVGWIIIIIGVIAIVVGIISVITGKRGR